MNKNKLIQISFNSIKYFISDQDLKFKVILEDFLEKFTKNKVNICLSEDIKVSFYKFIYLFFCHYDKLNLPFNFESKEHYQVYKLIFRFLKLKYIFEYILFVTDNPYRKIDLTETREFIPMKSFSTFSDFILFFSKRMLKPNINYIISQAINIYSPYIASTLIDNSIYKEIFTRILMRSKKNNISPLIICSLSASNKNIFKDKLESLQQELNNHPHPNNVTKQITNSCNRLAFLIGLYLNIIFKNSTGLITNQESVSIINKIIAEDSLHTSKNYSFYNSNKPFKYEDMKDIIIKINEMDLFIM